MINTFALAAEVLRFPIVELWKDSGNSFSCHYVYAEEIVVEDYSDVIIGHHPDHKRQHVISPAVRVKKGFQINTRLYKLLSISSTAMCSGEEIVTKIPLERPRRRQLQNFDRQVSNKDGTFVSNPRRYGRYNIFYCRTVSVREKVQGIKNKVSSRYRVRYICCGICM